MSTETLYPKHGNSPDRAENALQIAGNGPPSDEPGAGVVTEGGRILDLVKADLDARDRKGVETYGSSLRADSANDPLQYGYEEALDLAMYLRQEMERRAAGRIEKRGIADVCTCELASDPHIHAEDFDEPETGDELSALRAQLASVQRERDEAVAGRENWKEACRKAEAEGRSAGDTLEAALAAMRRERDEAREDEDPAVVTTIDDCTITIQHEDIMVAHALMLRLRALTDGEAVAR